MFAGVLALVLIGCERDTAGRDGLVKAEAGRVPAYEQRPGDPTRGRLAFVDRAAVTCGLPYSVYRRAVAKGRREPAPGLAERSGRNAELPYWLTAHVAASGVELVTSNCLGCHAAPLEGRLVVGLGNEFLDLTVDPLRPVEATSRIAMTDAERLEWSRWSRRLAAVADFVRTDTVGVNTAHHPTMALMAHREPRTFAWSDRPLIEPPPTRPLPVSVPPLWNLGKKRALFYNAQGRGDHVAHLLLAMTLCADSVEEVIAMDDWFVDVRAYLATLEPPPYPFPIDPVLAEQGEHLFERHCQGCHGRHGEVWRYPNKVIALGKIGTDPMLARQWFGQSDRFLRWFQAAHHGRSSWMAPALGYIAPPLDGVWATAPYLHNGSVPTIADLLDSRQRPMYWEYERAGDEPPVYDRARLGWSYRTLDHGKAGSMSWRERQRLYDTTLSGYGNQGHVFGDSLSEVERAALIEYLKRL